MAKSSVKKSLSPCKEGKIRDPVTKRCRNKKTPGRKKSSVKKASKKKTSENEFYCVKCRKRVKVDAKDMCVTVYKNKKRPEGIPALKAVCKKCGTNLTKFIKVDAKDKMIKKYGKC